LNRVFNVITFAAMSVGRSASMAPNYSKGKASAKRILELNARQSKIDPDDPSGIKLVRSLFMQNSLIERDVFGD
jgi:hypothetical protein